MGLGLTLRILHDLEHLVAWELWFVIVYRASCRTFRSDSSMCSLEEILDEGPEA